MADWKGPDDLDRAGMRRAGGFTLIEILVALILFALVGGLLLQTIQQGLHSVASAQQRARAAMLAQSQLEALSAFDDLVPTVIQGREQDGAEWRIQVEAAPDLAIAAQPPLTPLRVRITIRWEGADEQQATIETLLLSRWQP